jgi:peptide/nickel transport system permease protein
MAPAPYKPMFRAIPWALLLGLLLVVFFPSIIAPYTPDALATPYTPPGREHPLGTNAIGADNATLLLYSARTSLSIGILTALIAILTGTLLGTAAGYRRGRTDRAIMSFTDIFLLIPALPLLILLSAYSTPGLWGLVFILSLTSWPSTARVVRSAVLPFGDRGFIRSVKGFGASSFYITAYHVLPQVKGVIVGKALTVAAGAMAAEGGITFLGLADPRTMTWGAMIHDAFKGGAFINGSYWWYMPPVSAISLAVLVFTLLGRKIGEPQHPNLFSDIRPSRSDHTASIPPEKDKALSIRGLTVQLTPFGKGTPHTALERIFLDLGEGERLAIIGQTGGGKSVLLAAILRLLPEGTKVEGEIWIKDKPIFSLTDREMTRVRASDVAYVPQGAVHSLNPLIRVGRQITESPVVHFGIRRRQAETEAVSLLRNLHAAEPERWMRTFPHRLSGGMIQRAMLAAALMSDARLLLLDEPTKGLDGKSRDAVIEELLRQSSRRSFVVVTHDLSFVRKFATTVAVIHSSRIVEQSSRDAFFKSPLHPYSRAILDTVSKEWTEGDFAGIGDTDDNACSFLRCCPEIFSACSQAPPMMEAADQQVRCWKYAAGSHKHS